MKIETIEYLENLSIKYNVNFNIVLHYYWNEDIFTVEDELIEKKKQMN